MVLGQVDPAALEDACTAEPSWICETLFEATESEWLASTADFVFARPLKIVVVVVLAWVANRVLRRAIKRFTRRIADPASHERVRRVARRAPAGLLDTGEYSIRSAARAQTLAFVLRSVGSFAIWTLALLTILGELGINLGPVIAGAGIAGVALGFGAQSLVKDFLSGIFMLIEDQYGVGDIVDLGEATGTVEAVTLRTTKLRSVDGTVWHIPNGQIQRVGNMSQQWARALLDVQVAYGTDTDRAQSIIKDVADGLWREGAWQGRILEEPEVWGIETLGADGIAIRLVVKTSPSEQFTVMRELRRRLKAAFDEEGIEIPYPQRTVWVRRDPGSSRDGEGGAGSGADDLAADLDPDGGPRTETP
jgi:small conductance mechanosensitive channel